MNQYIKLNGEVFKVKKTNCKLQPITKLRSLRDCYVKPSSVKQEIYNVWFRWYVKDNNNYNLKHFTVNTFNSRMFTLAIDVYDKTDKFIGQLHITKTRQEFWTI